MNKKFLFLIPCLILTACISEQEQREAGYRYEQTLRNQCEHSLGFSAGTQNYMDCRMFYEEYLAAQGYDSSYMSFSKAQNIQNEINSLNAQCSRYWGREGLSGTNLWNCVQQLGEKVIEEAKHQKELREQQEMLTNSIAAGQKAANDDARLQSRIDAERDRVARETGKNPKKIKCKTYNKSNGYVQVKCK